MTVPRFRVLAGVEAVSSVALVVAVLAKRIGGVEGATAVVGPIHGLVYLAFAAGVVFLREELGWPARRALAAVAAAALPLGAHLIVTRRFLPA